jgi:Protein of unknown function (DUF3626)
VDAVGESAARRRRPRIAGAHLPARGSLAGLSLVRIAVAAAAPRGALEAPVHGVVNLIRDVEALVLDPCYRGTPIEIAARGLACPIQWHGGFTLTTTELRHNLSYRGLEFVDLGVSLSRNGRLDPRIIGDASRTGRYDQQALKRVWHYVARFGNPEMHALTRS